MSATAASPSPSKGGRPSIPASIAAKSLEELQVLFVDVSVFFLAAKKHQQISTARVRAVCSPLARRWAGAADGHAAVTCQRGL
jgi:hypothetical protein